MPRIFASIAAIVLSGAMLGVPSASAGPAARPTTTPIKHFIFMMQGDRSFDNYFGTYPGATGIPANTCQKLSLVGASDCVKPFPLNGTAPASLGAGTVELDNQYNNGAMDGFVAAYQSEGRDGKSTMGYYDQRDLPAYWSLASKYTLFDHFFSATRTGELANRSFWVSGAPAPAGTAAQVDAAYTSQMTIFDRLQAAGVSWKFYVQGYNAAQNYRTNTKTTPTTQPVRVPLLNYARFIDNPALSGHIVDVSQYYSDLKAGTLPAVSYITSSGPSERSANSIASGQRLTSDLISNLMLSSLWNSSAFMLSYDGSGGWYDNVAPPQVDKLGYGMRVPALLVSSYSRPGFIDHTAYDYTSALKFIEQNWGVRALASRDASATSIASAFDFQAGPQPPDLAFNRTAVARPPVGSVSVVYWLYGAALTLVLAVIGYAAISSRRSERRPLPSPPASAHEEPVGASR